MFEKNIELNGKKYRLKRQTKKEIAEEYVNLQGVKCGISCKIKRKYEEIE